MAHAYLKCSVASGPSRWCQKIPYDEGVARIKVAKARRHGRSKSIRALVQHGAGQLQAYQCDRCGWWHLGNREVR